MATNQGGIRPGAGRPRGTVKSGSRVNRLTQRYNNDEMNRIQSLAEQMGYGSDITSYIRDTVLGVRACKSLYRNSFFGAKLPSCFEVQKSDKQIRLEKQGCVFQGQGKLDDHEIDPDKPWCCGRPLKNTVLR